MALQTAFFDALSHGEPRTSPIVEPARDRRKKRGTSGYLLSALLLSYALCAVATVDAPGMDRLATPSP